MRRRSLSIAGAVAGIAAVAVAWSAPADAPPPVTALPSLDLAGYVGTWYQQALYPNAFQRMCVSDTTATYRDRGDGTIEVRNRCRTQDGSWTEALGLARPPSGPQAIDGGVLRPARLEVRFAPAWLSWLPRVWGAYWVVDRAPDGRYAIVSEPERVYLWVLTRTPTLSAADESEIRSRLAALGFDLGRLEMHPHSVPAAPPPASP